MLLALAVAAPAAAATTQPPRPGSIELGGTAVEGGTAQDPTPLTAGLWSDTLTGPGSPAGTRWFGYRRVMGGSTLVVGAVAVSPEEYGDSLEVEVSTPGGDVCDTTTQAQPTPAAGAAYGSVLYAAGDDDECGSSADLVIAVSRGTADFESEVPFTLRLVEEAPLSDEPGPEPADETALEPPEPGKPAATPGGTSFDDAPVVDGTVSDEVPPGTQRLWKVHLGWGQSLAWRLDVEKRPETDTFVPDQGVEVTLFDPLHNPFDGGATDAETTGSYGVEGSTLSDTTPPVAYLNRSDSEIAFVPGDYWVSVAVAPAEEDPLDVPVELTVAVTGEASDPPGFAEAVTGPGSTSGPSDYDRATPYLVGERVFSADVSGTPTGPGTEADASGTGRRVAGLVVGGLSLVSLLAGVVLLRRRSRATAAA